MLTSVLASNLSNFPFNTYAGHPQMWRYFILGLHLLHEVNYIARFIAQLTATCDSLFKLLKKDTKIEWTD